MPETDSLKHPQRFLLNSSFHANRFYPQRKFYQYRLTHLPCPDDAYLFTQPPIYVLSFTNNQL
ncbi:TPA: hypothetical protein ACHJP7_003596, partial [Escherichia coli]